MEASPLPSHSFQLIDLVESDSLEEEPSADVEVTVEDGDGPGKEALAVKAGGGSGSLESEVNVIADTIRWVRVEGLCCLCGSPSRRVAWDSVLLIA